MTELSSQSVSGRAGRPSLNPSLTLLVLLGLVLVATILRSRPWGVATQPVPPAIAAIDPNLASWWELTMLPRIGETLARRIVDYRESNSRSSENDPTLPVFSGVEGLQAVRGIGPKTLQRIGPYLRFSTNPGVTPPPPP